MTEFTKKELQQTIAELRSLHKPIADKAADMLDSMYTYYEHLIDGVNEFSEACDKLVQKVMNK